MDGDRKRADNVVPAVTKNCGALKFDAHGFDEE